MDLMQAKNLVIEAGITLVETGLIARTWGNVSCRVSADSFVITPSGKPYTGLKPEDIVEVKIEDLSYDGDVKPSSEKGVHALVYKAYPEANFVIHTHQDNASVVATFDNGIDEVTGEAREIIGKNILIGGYGMPGTGKLREGVAAALAASDSKAVLMARHGAVCFGKDSEEAFAVANTLEKVCAEYVFKKASLIFGKVSSWDEFSKKYAEFVTGRSNCCAQADTPVWSSRCDRKTSLVTFSAEGRQDVRMNLLSGAVEGEGKLPDFALYHRNAYLGNSSLNYIIHNNSAEAVALSALGKDIRPVLDDYAQIVGTKTSCCKKAADVKGAIKGQNALLIKDSGALCCGGNEGDAVAVNMIMSKAAKSILAARMFGCSGSISPVDSNIMRVVYTLKYSKKAEE